MKFKIEYISTFCVDISLLESDLENHPQKAKRLLEKMDDKLNNLTINPFLYPIYEHFPHFRRIILEDYLIFYVVNEGSKTIEIHRLIYGRMDVPTHLTDDYA